MAQAAILDVDGTLVDTNFHHTIAWYRAFRQHDVLMPIWRIHRSIGMGGDQIVPELAGEEIEEDKGEDIRTAEKALYMAVIEEVEPLTGARELIEDLKGRDLAVILASSAKPDEIEHYLDLLDARDLADGWTTSADVEATKPEPDLVEAALEKAGIRATVIKAGKYKTEGDPVVPLTGEARQAMQERADIAYSRFLGDVAAGRGTTPAEVRSGFGQGRLLGAKAALAAGLFDRIAAFDETLNRLTTAKGRALVPSPRARFSPSSRAETEVERRLAELEAVEEIEDRRRALWLST